MDCLFCKIINKDIPSEIVYEDDLVMVFLDINPTTNGDSLVVPKKHFKDMRDIDNETLIHMYDVIKKLYPIYQEKLHCDGLTISHNTDYGQDIKHFHIHFIPRYTTDEVKHLSNKEILKDIKEINNLLK
jgi:histidine triad (HIT) family protein